MKIRPILVGTILALATQHAPASEDASNAAAQANNSLANMTACNLQNYYIGRMTERDDDANQFWLRYAPAFKLLGGDRLMRASPPLNSYPTPPDGGMEPGLGGINAFAAYLVDTGNPSVSFGFGPRVTAPSATEDELGSGKWSAGFANVLFNAKSKKLQYGYLLTWQASFAGDSDREDVNIGAFQPFLFHQLVLSARPRDLSAFGVDLGLQLRERCLQHPHRARHRQGHPQRQDCLQPVHRAPVLGGVAGGRGSPTGRSLPDSICSSPINSAITYDDKVSFGKGWNVPKNFLVTMTRIHLGESETCTS
jgi:hypothetical protein